MEGLAMLIRASQAIEPKTLVMFGAYGVRMHLMVGKEHGEPNFSMRLLDVNTGGQSPHHQYNYKHDVLVLEDIPEVTGQNNDGTYLGRLIKPGNMVFIPANESHQFRNAGDTTLKLICLVPTTHDCIAEKTHTPRSQ